MALTYSIIVVFLFLLLLAYFRIADTFNIIDKPNARSSHSEVTIRGGGIIFPIAMLIAFALGHASIAFTLAILLSGAVSFIDDIKPLHQLPRFSAHMVSALLILYDAGVFEQQWWWAPIALILVISWINAFNFMDGINGITVLYALVTVTSFGYLYRDKPEFVSLVIMGISCLVFAFFNVRKKARTFAGDVGSISMAIFVCGFMIKTIAQTQESGYIVFFCVYGTDAAITILYRLRNKENIFLPHRSHLYQYLANEMKWSHLQVSAVYAIVQLLINIVAIYAISRYTVTWLETLLFLLLFAGIYLVARLRVLHKISQ
jgi:UDP-N-acetylmuramyl pentapeptide phosphotransferase/UDP-N-acetylglucosamine-1-phosphate transferase